MDCLLDFEDCVKDSPEFRYARAHAHTNLRMFICSDDALFILFRLALDQFETDVSQLETKLDKVQVLLPLLPLLLLLLYYHYCCNKNC